VVYQQLAGAAAAAIYGRLVAALGEVVPERVLALSEPARPEPARPEQTRPEQTPPEQTPPEQTPPEQTPPEQTPPEQTPPEQALRWVGLSAAKAASIRDLAVKVTDGTVVLDPAGLRTESDAEVVARLSTVRGIGKWTAEMFLMFQLRRLDVWPTGDLAVRKGFGLAWGIPTPTAKELDPMGDPYRPYRSVLAWYCWRAAEIYQGTADSALTR
jgi:DNA-3-methyladenine glycosylase II